LSEDCHFHFYHILPYSSFLMLIPYHIIFYLSIGHPFYILKLYLYYTSLALVFPFVSALVYLYAVYPLLASIRSCDRDCLHLYLYQPIHTSFIAYLYRRISSLQYEFSFVAANCHRVILYL
jgi:hypothetical protein